MVCVWALSSPTVSEPPEQPARSAEAARIAAAITDVILFHFFITYHPFFYYSAALIKYGLFLYAQKHAVFWQCLRHISFSIPLLQQTVKSIYFKKAADIDLQRFLNPNQCDTFVWLMIISVTCLLYTSRCV